MKKFLTPFNIFLLLVTLGIYFFLSQISFPDSSYNFLGKSNRVELTSGAPVTQVFTAKQNELEGIKIIMGNDEVLPGEKIELGLFDATCTQKIASQTITVWSWPSSIYRSFRFSKMTDSAGKQFCLSILYRSPYKLKDRPIVYASEGGQFIGMSYTDTGKNKVYADRTLQIRPSYGEESFVGRIKQLENRLSQYKPVFTKHHMLLLASAVVILSVLLAYVLSRAIKQED